MSENVLLDLIRSEINEQGPITLARFMELALYHPRFGYYENAVPAIGKSGDFYTSVSVGPLFAELLGFQFAEWLQSSSGPVQIIEAGAHDGQFALDLLGYLKEFQGPLFDQMEYWILDPSPPRRQRQAETLAPFASKIKWFNGWNEILERSVNGIVFSNELLDAMPVHQFRWDRTESRWVEWGIGLNAQQELAFQKLARRSDIDENYLPEISKDLASVVPGELIIEVSPIAIAWWSRAAQRLKSGFLVTFDYGGQTEDLLAKGGTLRAYRQHHYAENPLADPGEQDITADVNFSQLIAAGEAAGLLNTQLFSQSRFLQQIFAKTLSSSHLFPPWHSRRSRQFQTLTHPEHLGRSFKALIQHRVLGPEDKF